MHKYTFRGNFHIPVRSSEHISNSNIDSTFHNGYIINVYSLKDCQDLLKRSRNCNVKIFKCFYLAKYSMPSYTYSDFGCKVQ